MKLLKCISLMLLGLLISLGASAQTIVTGSNLNIGSNNTLSSNRGNAIGIDHWLGGNNSLAVGNNDTIMSNANSSIALGSLNRIGGLMSMAMGCNVKIGNSYSIGIGHDLNLTGSSGCMAIGSGIIGSGANPNVSLENSYGNSLLIGFHSTKPTLTIGPSPNNYPNGDTLTKTGKVAIGDVPVPNIAAKLHIRSDYGEDAGIILEPKDPMTSNTFIRMRDENHGVEVDKDGVMIVKSSTTHSYNGSEVPRPIILKGIVGVNIDNYYYEDLTGAYGLWVKGGIKTEKVTIKYYGSWWSDYVFNVDYPLMPLNDLREYIRKNHHLPDVPSEAEVMDNGIELGNMQSVLLKKIEELTLYTLKQQDEIEALKQTIEELKGK